METINKKCIVFKKDGNTPKITQLELSEYCGMYVREIPDIWNNKMYDVYLEHKGYCIKVGTVHHDLERYKNNFEAVSNNKITALKRIFPNRCILELFRLTNEPGLHDEFLAIRNLTLSKREKSRIKLEKEQEEVERMEQELKEKEHDDIIKKSVDKWNNKQEVSNVEFLELCKLNNIDIHPKTLHFINVSLVSVSGNRHDFKFRKQINSRGKVYAPKYDNFCNVLDELNKRTTNN